ncbi:Rid family hydrolase [Microbacterium terricola]|uniref:Enamine deaminase RidA n=1 Tax=Microbacterium terricola TaxID=344163 RepID=A0ABM8E108_9MICO|nr:Rid family hydrolase [Microbacterium terricola]UYK40639.1 Rid family hydrolase [Microbacterium terricola]BDV31628.1 enamine deaminase RidA [Microbacterium terricola]
MRTIVTVPVLSESFARLGVPLTLVNTAGPTVYVSGLPPYDPETGELVRGDIATQTDTCLRALAACLTAAGASFDDVVNVRIYAANAGHYRTINEVYARHFTGDAPTRVFVPVASWSGEFDIEIDAVAYLSPGDAEPAA